MKRLFGFLLFGVGLLVSLGGCAASSDVKRASSEMTLALDEYDRDVDLFRDLYVSEIEQVQKDVGRAVVLRAVRLDIERLAGSDWQFSSMSEDFKRSGLTALAQRVEETQAAAGHLVGRALAQELSACEQGAEDKALDALDQSKALRISAGELRKSGNAEAADKLNKVADTMEKTSGQALADDQIRAYLTAILHWGCLKKQVPTKLEHLKHVVAALKQTHATVDAWIQTDVSPSAGDIGKLVVEHKALLAPSGAQEGQ